MKIRKIFVPHDIFPLCENFRILSCNDIVEEYNLANFLGENSKTPDHATITFELKVPSHTRIPPVNENKPATKKRYNLRRIPPSQFYEHRKNPQCNSRSHLQNRNVLRNTRPNRQGLRGLL